MEFQIHAIRRLVERTVEGSQEEHEHLGTHTQEQEEVSSGQVRQLKKRTQNNDRGTPRIGIVQKGLTRHTIHPLLQAVYKIQFTVCCHCDLQFDDLPFTIYFFFDFFNLILSLVVLASERTQRKPTYERGWFWYSYERQAERMYDSGSFQEPPRTLFFFSR